MDHGHKVDFRLGHHVDVGEAISCLVRRLGCDSWYVACHYEQLFVFRLAKGTEDRFAVRIECNAPVEKGVYHGSKAWSLSISPLHNGANLTEEQISKIQSALALLK